MNTDKLRELVDHILDVEAKTDTQGKLSQLASALSNLSSSPQNADFQTQLAAALKQFNSSMARFQFSFAPRDQDRLLDLAPEAFARSLVDDVANAITQNGMSPAVASNFVQTLLSKRSEVFTRLRELQTALAYFQIEQGEPTAGAAELGFQIPRDLFANNLPGLIKELRDLDLIIKFFSEAAIGKYEPAKVGSISTTDPLVFLSVAEEVAKTIALAVSWAVGTWYAVEQIRNLRAETAKIKAFTPEDIEGFFDSKIKKEIDNRVEAKVAEILADSKVPNSRHGELGAHLEKALNALLAKVERGMTIELRIGPPQVTGDSAEAPDDDGSSRQVLRDIQETLVFPTPSDNPVLPIPDLKDDKPARTR